MIRSRRAPRGKRGCKLLVVVAMTMAMAVASYAKGVPEKNWVDRPLSPDEQAAVQGCVVALYPEGEPGVTPEARATISACAKRTQERMDGYELYVLHVAKLGRIPTNSDGLRTFAVEACATGLTMRARPDDMAAIFQCGEDVEHRYPEFWEKLH
ncbi:hypothetical protein PAN31117_05260 [Pandoraea anapnoica]|uniref:Uncharacterized protein n=1 Tax=Pandoraea anapnoica TaxID=2508301 RepID=A0A5E5ATL5_9BURK|nr:MULTISPECIES: hypothetical protein [Pandoraea]VVE59249.1 hypothetical protein PIN31009_05471 [Pandoraea iniqua]VVE75823.1 hypothetical protein PAN31117_05260 [Pandoraea anapnoica]